MKTNRRVFIKNMNWALAGIIGMLGFTGCDITGTKEYGSPHADYTVKGKVVSKTTGKPIEGIQVGLGYSYSDIQPMYGTRSAPFTAKSYVLTNAKGEFKITDRSEIVQKLPASVEDIDGEENGLFQSKQLEIDFKDAVHSGKSKNWYKGEYTVTVNVELTEIEKE